MQHSSAAREERNIIASRARVDRCVSEQRCLLGDHRKDLVVYAVAPGMILEYLYRQKEEIANEQEFRFTLY